MPWLEIGGADQFNLQLLEGLKRRGWSLTIITTLKSDHPLQNSFYLITQDIFHLANFGDEAIYSSSIEYVVKSRSLSKIFVSNSLYGYYLLPWLKRKFPRISIVDYIHCEELNWYNGGYPFFSAVYTNLIDKTYVSSKHLRNWCIRKGVNPDKIEVCYTNIDAVSVKKDFFQRIQKRNELQLSNNKPVIIYVARLTPQKQPLIMTSVLAELKKKESGLLLHYNWGRTK
ncbi:MAG: glycosyltransferase [Bacteroidota bacterium]